MLVFLTSIGWLSGDYSLCTVSVFTKTRDTAKMCYEMLVKNIKLKTNKTKSNKKLN